MSNTASIGFTIIRLGVDIAEGNATDAIAAARQLFDLGTSLIPVDKQKDFLTARDKLFTDLEMDVAEDIKFDATKP